MIHTDSNFSFQSREERGRERNRQGGKGWGGRRRRGEMRFFPPIAFSPFEFMGRLSKFLSLAF